MCRFPGKRQYADGRRHINGSGFRKLDWFNFTLILDFSTCVGDPNKANIVTCQERHDNGKPAGQIAVTFQSNFAGDGTCPANPLCNGTCMRVTFTPLMEEPLPSAQPQPIRDKTPFQDENGFAPTLGFSQGAITSGTGKYQGISGTLTMRWDANVCICLFDIIEP